MSIKIIPHAVAKPTLEEARRQSRLAIFPRRIEAGAAAKKDFSTYGCR